MLGAFKGQKKTERKSGESWCMVWGTDDGLNWDLYPKAAMEIGDDNDPAYKGLKNIWTDDHNKLRREFSAGQRQAIYSCSNGNIVVTQGDQFRAVKGICMQNDEARFYLVGTENEKYATCEYGFTKEGADITDLGRGPVTSAYLFMKNLQSVYTGRNRQKTLLDTARDLYKKEFNMAILIDNYEYTNHCERPRYPVGSHFYTEISVQEEAPQNLCATAGGSAFDTNLLDRSECFRKGDCSYSQSFGFGGCVKGAIALEAVYLTAGSVGLHSGGGWGSLFTSGAATSGATSVVPEAALPGQAVLDPGIGAVTGTGTNAIITQQSASASAQALIAKNAARNGVKILIIKQGGTSTAQQVTQYIAAAGAGQQVVASFSGPRQTRNTPDYQTQSNLGDASYNANTPIPILEQITDSQGNIWGKIMSTGEFILLSSPDGSNPATLSYRNTPVTPP